jgi:hypothetical protein
MIHVCVDYRDISKACYKDNYPTPFIDHIIDDCVGSEIFSLDGFSGYNQINILPADQHKPYLFSLGEPSPTGNYALVSKMLAQLFNMICLTLFMILSTL